MIKLIGSTNCGRCEIVKNLLTNKGIEFEYLTLEGLSQEEQTKYMTLARSKGIMNLPLIIKDEQLITLEEV